MFLWYVSVLGAKCFACPQENKAKSGDLSNFDSVHFLVISVEIRDIMDKIVYVETAVVKEMFLEDAYGGSYF